MTPTHGNYLLIRERFLDVFIRDVLKWGSSKKSMAIENGNSLNQEGDCVTGANLFMSGRRLDHEIMQVIYGVSASKVQELGKLFTIRWKNILFINVLAKKTTVEA